MPINLKRASALVLAALAILSFSSCGDETGVKPDMTVTEAQTAPEKVVPAQIKKINEKAAKRWHTPIFAASRVFGSDMVLQRDEVITVWGFSDTDGSVVTGTFDGETATATVTDGEWALGFAPRSASDEPKTMTVTDDRGNTVEFSGILIGDVYIISGQSNAELVLNVCMQNYDGDAEFDGNAPFRLFHQDQIGAASAKNQWEIPQPNTLNIVGWGWQKPDRDNSGGFSALGYYFAKTVSEKSGVPVGIIAAYASGSTLRELMPYETVLERELPLSNGTVSVSGYYNTLMYPFAGLRIKGLIFFQGESDSLSKKNADRYGDDLVAYVTALRENFGFDFEFYNVQLCDYGASPSWKYCGITRITQYEAYKTLSDSYLIPSFDLGSDPGQDPVHSPKKKALAERLAAVVLADSFSIGDISENTPPEVVSAEISGDKSRITLKFKNVGSGLQSLSGGQTVEGFVYGKWANQIPCEAVITDRDTVVVTIPENDVRGDLYYAYQNHIIPIENAQLINSNGVPAPAFNVLINGTKK